MTQHLITVAVICLGFSLNAHAEDGCQNRVRLKCSNVHGTYATYVENDAIRVSGTRRLIIATSDELDKMISQKGGWQEWQIRGDFFLCSETGGWNEPVCMKSYKNLKLVKRP